MPGGMPGGGWNAIMTAWHGTPDKAMWINERVWSEADFGYVEVRWWQEPDAPVPVSEPPFRYVDRVDVL